MASKESLFGLGHPMPDTGPSPLPVQVFSVAPRHDRGEGPAGSGLFTPGWMSQDEPRQTNFAVSDDAGNGSTTVRQLALTMPPGGGPAREAGIGFRTYFQVMYVDHAARSSGRIIDG